MNVGGRGGDGGVRAAGTRAVDEGDGAGGDVKCRRDSRGLRGGGCGSGGGEHGESGEWHVLLVVEVLVQGSSSQSAAGTDVVSERPPEPAEQHAPNGPGHPGSPATP
jgi:hypothetical protein